MYISLARPIPGNLRTITLAETPIESEKAAILEHVAQPKDVGIGAAAEREDVCAYRNWNKRVSLGRGQEQHWVLPAEE